jgi:uncharacterized membrane protein
MIATGGATQAQVGRWRRNRLLIAVALGLCVAAIVLTWVGAADPPIDLRNSAFWFRTLRKFPGVLDVCGDFTWAARMVPSALAVLGGLSALMVKPRTRLSLTVAVIAFALAAVLAFLTTQNAAPWGEQGCILD